MSIFLVLRIICPVTFITTSTRRVLIGFKIPVYPLKKRKQKKINCKNIV